MPKAPVLMAADNPQGWKLEELLAQMRNEIFLKNKKIENDDRPEARRVLANNKRILMLLSLAEELQTDSMETLKAIGPNQGPTGTPRIGVGSVQAKG